MAVLTRSAFSLVMVCACLATIVSPTMASSQDSLPYQGDSAEFVYDVAPQNTWGVTGFDPGSGNFNFTSPIFALEQVGGRIYAGGKFLRTTNGTEEGEQPYLAAFNRYSGKWDKVFRPQLDWSVFDLATDGNRLFVGGEFSNVNGYPAAGIVALNPVTGNTDPSFSVSIGSGEIQQTRIHTLEVADSWLYLGGWFTSITGSNGTHAVSHAARVRLSDGAVDPNWRPKIQTGVVWDIAADKAHERVLLGGTFKSVGEKSTEAFAAVDFATGDVLEEGEYIGRAFFDEPRIDYDYVSAIKVSGDRVVLGGQRHRLLVLDENLDVMRVYTSNRYGSTNDGAGGDFQAIEIAGDKVFASCHCWGRLVEDNAELEPITHPMDVRSLIAIDLPSGDLDLGFAPDFSGKSGPWALLVDNKGCLWVGTDAVQAGQRQGKGLGKYCQKENFARQGSTTITMSTQAQAPGVGLQFINDGNRVTNFPAASGSAQSLPEPTPYIDIDLGANYPVGEVIIWNRTDGKATTRDLSVLAVSNSEFDGWTASNNPSNGSFLPGDHRKKRTLTVPVNKYVRYLRIQANYTSTSAGVGALDLIEVAVTEATGDVAGGPTIELKVFQLAPGTALNKAPVSWVIVR